MSLWKESLTAKPEETAHASAEKFNARVMSFIATHPLHPERALREVRDEVLREAIHQGLPSPLTLWLVDDCNTTVGFLCRTQHDDGNRVAVYVERTDLARPRLVPVFEIGVMVTPPSPVT